MESRRRIVELKGIRRLALVLLAAPASSGAGAALTGPARAAAPSPGLGADGCAPRASGRGRPLSRLQWREYDAAMATSPEVAIIAIERREGP
jgi:hypothetical protein